MKERAEKRCPMSKPQAWWVQQCLRTQDFSSVESSDLSPKRKLYVAYSIIINLAVKLGLLEVALQKEDLSIALVQCVVFIQQHSKNQPFIQAVLKFAGENVYEGVYEDGAFEVSEPEVALAIGLSTGGNSATMRLQQISEKYEFTDAESLTNTFIEALKKLAETPINEVHFHEITSTCPMTQKPKFELSTKGKILEEKERVLDKRVSPLYNGFKPPSHPVIQENVRCPALDAGVFPEVIRLAALKVYQPAQPDD